MLAVGQLCNQVETKESSLKLCHCCCMGRCVVLVKHSQYAQRAPENDFRITDFLRGIACLKEILLNHYFHFERFFSIKNVKLQKQITKQTSE